jgi:hypothetical protein
MTWICSLGSALFGSKVWYLLILVRASDGPFFPAVDHCSQFQILIRWLRSPDSDYTNYSTLSAHYWACSCHLSLDLEHLVKQMQTELEWLGSRKRRVNREDRPSCEPGWKKATCGSSNHKSRGRHESRHRGPVIDVIVSTKMHVCWKSSKELDIGDEG